MTKRSLTEDDFPVKLFGRTFTREDLEQVRAVVARLHHTSRAAIAREVCRVFHWKNPNGKLKAATCRKTMLRLHRSHLIQLPQPKRKHTNTRGTLTVKHTSRTDAGDPIHAPVHQLKELEVIETQSTDLFPLWKEYIDRYHYLGYTRIPGAQMHYLVRCSRGWLGAVGFGPAVWCLQPRDDWIGWTHKQRETNLFNVVGNVRFLILPWVQSKNLASRVLSMCIERLSADWEERYGRQPVLLETFVEDDKFEGTMYKAANWTFIGHTKANGTGHRFEKRPLTVKKIFVYPLQPNFRKVLTR